MSFPQLANRAFRYLRMSRNRDKVRHMVINVNPDCPTQHRAAGRRVGFTITEILIVIGVISVLMGILLPVLSKMRVASHQTVEQNAARQLMIAYTTYANVNRDHVLTGDPDGLNFRVYDQNAAPIGGGPLGEIAKRRYPWRLAPYLDFDMRAMYNNMQRDMLDELKGDSLYEYKVAMFPSLGLNAQWVGGDFSATGFASADPTSHLSQTYGRFWVRSTAEVVQPERLIVFASARGADSMTGATNTIEGYFKVESPRFSAINPEPRWAPRFYTNLLPGEYGHISPRYFGEAVIGFMDGHVGSLNPDQLRDMRHWANRATHEDWAIQANTPTQ